MSNVCCIPRCRGNYKSGSKCTCFNFSRMWIYVKHGLQLSHAWTDLSVEEKDDYLEEIQYWMRHYDEETERRETEMINLKASMEKLTEDYLALKEKYDARKAEMEDWLSYKKRKKEKEELEALQIWAATKIQAWWRGVMFRKKLGPYRKKKKGKDKDKGKKGKKK